MANKPNPAVQAFLASMAEAAKKRRAEQAEQQPPIPTTPTEPWASPADTLTTIKPDEQEIDVDKLVWKWKVGEDISVYAQYYTQDSPEMHHGAGEYVIQMYLEQEDSYLNMGSDYARNLATVLLSAAQWEDMWQHYMGEFFAAKKPEAPELKVVNDDATETTTGSGEAS